MFKELWHFRLWLRKVLGQSSVKSQTPSCFERLGAEKCRVFKSQKTAEEPQSPFIFRHLSVSRVTDAKKK